MNGLEDRFVALSLLNLKNPQPQKFPVPLTLNSKLANTRNAFWNLMTRLNSDQQITKTIGKKIANSIV